MYNFWHSQNVPSIDTSGMLFWLNGGNYSIGTLNVSGAQLTDLSGNGNHFTTTSATAIASRPTLVPNALNGHPVLNFDGSQWLNRTGVRYTAWTTFVVARTTISNVTTTNQCILGTSASNGATATNSHRFEISGPTVWTGAASGGKLTYMWTETNTIVGGYANISVAQNSWFNACQATGSSDNTPTYYNNMSLASVVANATGLSNNTSSTDWGIGQSGSFAAYRFTGQIAEIIFYTRKLSESEVLKVQLYLKNKYGL